MPVPENRAVVGRADVINRRDRNRTTAPAGRSCSRPRRPRSSPCGCRPLVRRLKLEACRKPALSKVLESFWPRSNLRERFQPEPGCSEPTFVGSNADLAGLSARMLNSVARAIAKPDDCQTGAGWLFEESGPVHAFAWHPSPQAARHQPGASPPKHSRSHRPAPPLGRTIPREPSAEAPKASNHPVS